MSQSTGRGRRREGRVRRRWRRTCRAACTWRPAGRHRTGLRLRRPARYWDGLGKQLLPSGAARRTVYTAGSVHAARTTPYLPHRRRTLALAERASPTARLAPACGRAADHAAVADLVVAEIHRPGNPRVVGAGTLRLIGFASDTEGIADIAYQWDAPFVVDDMPFARPSRTRYTSPITDWPSPPPRDGGRRTPRPAHLNAGGLTSSGSRRSRPAPHYDDDPRGPPA